MTRYAKFALMIATSTAVMFGLMYLNTYSLDHVYWSETRAYMALIMGAAMALVMLAFMVGMYPDKKANLIIVFGAAAIFAVSLYLVRSQRTIEDVSWMKAMIPPRWPHLFASWKTPVVPEMPAFGFQFAGMRPGLPFINLKEITDDRSKVQRLH